MAVMWTPEQKRVIDSREQNLLVAAAAGSGKTAVLVEHIMELVTDPLHPVDVTGLLVVTFTRAAASEMKERLRGKLEERLEEEPWNLHVQKQIPLLSQAHISTIDSFCQWMVKNYFYQLDIDPDFRVPDEGEGKLLREEVLDKVLEEYYGGEDKDFFHFMDAFSSGKNDRNIRDLIEKLYLFADSAPWPERWIRGQIQSLEEEVSGLEEYSWAGTLEEELRGQLREYRRLLSRAAEECSGEPGLEKYAQMFLLDVRQAESCLEAVTLTEFLRRLGDFSFVRKPVISKKTVVDASLKERMSLLRDTVKENIQRLVKRFAGLDADQAVTWIQATAGDRRVLLELTLSFAEAYGRAKRERNLADFADIEHWALDLLVKWEDGQCAATPLAGELGDTFREIIVDEYQDSNLVQETILAALSGESRGHFNMFMVGDVKQSIYKFRMARPELFMDKYRRFSYEAQPPGQKIDLGRNFRSRSRILNEVNEVFFRIMGEELGGVEYDEHAALYYGASYPGEDEAVELLVAEREEDEADAVELEGKMIAARIRRLLDPNTGMKVWEEKEKTFRPAQYRDIVILLRSMEGWADNLAAILNQEGIPAFAQLKKGYFAAQEVQVLLNFLRVLDNPLQDIPLVSVLRSPLGGFSEEELAWMAAGTMEGDFYHRCCQAAQWGRNTGKWQRFQEFLDKYRRRAVVRPIHEILEEVLGETDYGLMLAASPGGKVRTANVDMLMEKAMAFGETSYHGIFQFIRYMEKLQRYQVDYGEAQVLSENENLIRITSIHKSKGLEYPIVIVAGMGKGFNLQDTRSSILLHEDWGLACDAVDVKLRVRRPTLWKRVMAERMERDTKGEELRILYVAMTRAKEKLILTGTCGDWEKLSGKWMLAGMLGDPQNRGKLPASLVVQGNSFLDWILMASTDNPDCHIQVQLCQAASLVEEEVLRLGEKDWRKQQWESIAGHGVWDEEFRRRFRDICGYSYPWRSVCRQKAALSVSELKHKAAEEYLAGPEGGSGDSPLPMPGRQAPGKMTEEGALRQAKEPVELQSCGLKLPEKPEMPDKTGGKRLSGPGGGARRGTIYHKVLERIPPDEGGDEGLVRRYIRQMVQDKLLTEEEGAVVSPRAITGFYTCELGRKMVAAWREGRLYREQPFVMGVPLREVLPEVHRESVPEGEWVLVQGIIDAFLEEDGELILWDYKTDAVPKAGGEERLLGLYREQLLEYKKALERARNQRVKEMWIYSFALGRAIRVP